MTGRVIIPTVQDIEEVCYPIACQVFSEPEYSMPPLRWLDKKNDVGPRSSAKHLLSDNSRAGRRSYLLHKQKPPFVGRQQTDERYCPILLFSS